MKKPIGRYKAVGFAVVAAMVMNQTQVGQAGWTGCMNGRAYGWASVDVISSTLKENAATTDWITNPSAAISPAPGYVAVNVLPNGSSPSTTARVLGSSGYVWDAITFSSGGDLTGNTNVESIVTIVRADCPELAIASALTSSNGQSGIITVNAIGTLGTGLRLRTIEYLGQGVPTNMDQLISNSVKWADIVLVGPFNLTTTNCNPLTIPVTVQTDFTNLFFVSDGVAKSNPFMINCPSNVAVGCTDTNYPLPTVSGGCGSVTVTYSPAVESLSNGVPTLVTLTAHDEAGNTNQCTFTATRTLLSFDGFFAPISGFGGSCTNALRNINKGSVVPVKFQVTCNGVHFDAGTPTLTIQSCATGQILFTGDFHETSSVFNVGWDTTGPDFPIGVYRLIATLQDGTTREVYVRLTKKK
jgi:hypothetical protein